MAGEPLPALIREYPAHTILFEENDPGSRMFVIRSGRVRIFRRLAGSEIVLAFLGPGDFFGEMALLEGLPRSASAEVVEDARLIEVDSGTFEEMIRGNIEIAVRMMRKLASRLRESDRHIEHLLEESAVGRAIEVLRWLQGQGAPDADWSRLKGAAGHIDLAAQAGIPPAQAEAVLRQLQHARCLAQDGGDLLIARREHLDEYAAYLDMRRSYDFETQLPSEASSVRQEERLRAMQALLKALKITPEDLEARQQALADGYRRYIQLKRRFKSFEEAEP
jgi:CRP/FNR family cyclic AMP-dependent transcriptional regulator